ncbi:MAG: SUMF1/EgtB/PvdO family nonheme iron enzyme [Candidatus Thiodiazotropha sp.]
MASLTVETRPIGARVSLAGRFVGETPLAGLALGIGTYAVQLALDGYREITRSVTLVPDAEVMVFESLVPLTGTLRVRAKPAWETLRLNDRSYDVASGVPIVVPAGVYEVRASRPRHLASARIEVGEGNRVEHELRWYLVEPDPVEFERLEAATVEIGARVYEPQNPPRRIIFQPFWISRREVTVGAYARCVHDGACAEPPTEDGCNWRVEGREKHPINCVSGEEARAYAEWLALRDELPYRLPTTDEFERATHRGQDRARACNTCDRRCVWRYRDADADDGFEQTAPVGSLAGCRDGTQVMDLIGNVAELCWSPVSQQFEVRGGSFGDPAAFLDPAYPRPIEPTRRDPTQGFRLVMPEFEP